MPYKFNPLTGKLDYYETGANKELSNLEPTSINEDLLPEADETKNLGSAAKSWAEAFVGKIQIGSNFLTTWWGHITGIEFDDDSFVSTKDTDTVDASTKRLSITTGAQTGASGTGRSGHLDLHSGDVMNGATGNSGDVSVQTGHTGAGTPGTLYLRTGSSSTNVRGPIYMDGRHVDVNSMKIINLADPVDAQDAATKSWVQTEIPALSYKYKLVAKARLTSAQTFTTAGAYQVIAYNTEDIDVFGAFTTGAGAKFTVPSGQDGNYLVIFEFTSDATNKTVNDEIWLGHAKSGTNQSGSFSIHHIYATGSYATTHSAIAWPYPNAVAGDYFQAILRPIGTQKISHTNTLFSNTICIYKME